MRIDLPLCGFKNCRFSFDGNCTNKIEYDRCEYRLAKGEIDDVAPVRRGRWKTYGIAEVCDQCNLHIVIEQYSEGDINYCPNCGAKMDGGGKNE